ncbi:MAG: helix-turn-helix domain-containing protein [Acidaminococcaceae bacterium]
MEERLARKVVVPQRLREARIAKGLTIKEVSDTLGISRQLLSLYELGNTAIKLDNVLKLQAIYNMPMSFYYKKCINDSINRSQIYFRSFYAATKVKRDQAKILADWTINEISGYVKDKIVIPPLDSLCERIRESKAIEIREKRDMESLAKLIRREWKLGVGPIPNLTRLLEKKGFIIVELDIDETLDAFSFWDNGRPYIFISKYNNAVRRRMSIAHELCHLLFHDAEDVSKNLKNLEVEAKEFASCFLMPQGGFDNDVVSTALNQLLLLKPVWKVSVAAMLVRCQSLGLISDERSTYLWKQISRNHWRKAEPYDDELQPERPVLLKQSIKLLVDNNIVSREEIINAISLGDDFVEQVCNLEKSYFDKGSETVMLSQRV